MEKIKVVYSWMGPRGPIWNTELPNVLSFAGVAEQCFAPNSPYWWADGTWGTMFRHDEDTFEAYPTFSIKNEDTSTFVMPFTLSWRLQLSNYFCGNTGLFEYAHVSGHIIDLIRNGNGYLLIDHSIEAFMQPYALEAMHSYFSLVHHIPLHKIIYITGCINAKSIYEEYCAERNIPNDLKYRLSIIPYPSSINAFTRCFEPPNTDPEYDVNYFPEKLFLMWNRRIRQHRAELTLNLEAHDLIDRSYVSFSERDIENPMKTMEQHLCLGNILGRAPWLTNEVVERFKSKLPLVIDGEDQIGEMCGDTENKSRPYYQNSLVSIVTETNFFEPEISLTEKSFKPFKEKHPFITVGVSGALQGLKDLGFKTFSDFWDESYDTVADPYRRLDKIVEVLYHIGQWTPEQILAFRVNVKPIVEHNYNLLKNQGQTYILNQISKVMRTA